MLQLLIYILLFIVGSVFGSFIDVMATRTVQGKNFLLSRSQCEKCLKNIWPIDMIPLLSYVLLGGKCRFCKTKIPARLFLIELATGLLFTVVYIFAFSDWISFTLLLVIMMFLVAIIVVDFLYGIIPDQFLVAIGVTSVFLLLSQGVHPIQFGMHIVAGLLGFGFFFLIFLLTRGRGMGFGDVKFSFFIGFLLSFQLMIFSFYAAFLTGAAISLILILVGKKRLRGDTIPFGPFLSLGVIACLLFENQIREIVRAFFHI